jgi:hypothetical protein
MMDSDRDPKFISGFWRTLWRRIGTRVNMSFSRYLETDGLTKRVNKKVHHLLRCFCRHDGSYSTAMLPFAELAYNATCTLGIEYTPFDEANFGFTPKEPPYILFSMRRPFRFRKTQ